MGVLWSQVKGLEDVDDNDSRNISVHGKMVCEKYAGVIRGNLRVYSRASLAMRLIGQRWWILSHTKLVQQDLLAFAVKSNGLGYHIA